VQQQIQAIDSGNGDARTGPNLREDATRLATLADVRHRQPADSPARLRARQPDRQPRTDRSCWASCSASYWASAWHSCASRPTGACTAPTRCRGVRGAGAHDRSAPPQLKRNKPFSELPPEIAEAFRMLQAKPALCGRAAGHERAGHVLAQPRGQDHDRLEPSLGGGFGRPVGAIVEADMRRPSIASRYGLQPHPGLAEVLSGQVPIADAVQAVATVARATRNGYTRPMDVLVAGDPPANPSALMQSNVMLRVLDVLRKDHDLVVVDTPPVAHVADAISLLRHVDGVLVAAAVSSTRSRTRAACATSSSPLDAHILGVVANGGSACTAMPTPRPARRAAVAGAAAETARAPASRSTCWANRPGLADFAALEGGPPGVVTSVTHRVQMGGHPPRGEQASLA